MADGGSTRQGPRMAYPLTVALLILVLISFAVAFVVSTKATTSTAIDVQSYATDVAAALSDAAVSEGKTLFEALQCGICNVTGEGRVAPSLTGIADSAETERQPLSAEQYLYESIVSPGAYLVDGYANAMPANFGDRLTRAEIGHVIAYLLSASGAEEE